MGTWSFCFDLAIGSAHGGEWIVLTICRDLIYRRFVKSLKQNEADEAFFG